MHFHERIAISHKYLVSFEQAGSKSDVEHIHISEMKNLKAREIHSPDALTIMLEARYGNFC